MKLLNKILLLLSFTLFLLSCNSKEKSTPEIKQATAKDTTTIANPESTMNLYAAVDLSPMDISYFPADYPKIKMSDPSAAPPFARVIYSRPHLQGRKLFPAVLKYGDHWRLGANEATELQLFKQATILGEKVKAGRYILYCIPEPDKWTIILNSNIDSWGLIQDSTKDVAHFTIPAAKNTNRLEFFSMVFEKVPGGAELLMAWDDIEAKLPISF